MFDAFLTALVSPLPLFSFPSALAPSPFVVAGALARDRRGILLAVCRASFMYREGGGGVLVELLLRRSPRTIDRVANAPPKPTGERSEVARRHRNHCLAEIIVAIALKSLSTTPREAHPRPGLGQG